ncbi:hypothetical protein PR048_004007 [Dryococelus australis]|uniref:Uncharacterized protein n=1 Tax=Dryococelus australis TaxID=614101 RepID=A0ABQ9I4B9_9NEOP|nr:hypothetical protein PR048_004007 [Dryococelus australis]
MAEEIPPQHWIERRLECKWAATRQKTSPRGGKSCHPRRQKCPGLGCSNSNPPSIITPNNFVEINTAQEIKSVIHFATPNVPHNSARLSKVPVQCAISKQSSTPPTVSRSHTQSTPETQCKMPAHCDNCKHSTPLPNANQATVATPMQLRMPDCSTAKPQKITATQQMVIETRCSRSSVASTVISNQRLYPFKDEITLVAAMSILTPLKFDTLINLNIQGNNYPQSFLVVGNLKQDLILGVNFIRRYDVIHVLKYNVFFIHSHDEKKITEIPFVSDISQFENYPSLEHYCNAIDAFEGESPQQPHINSNLSAAQTQVIADIIDKYSDCFANSILELTEAKCFEIKLGVTTDKPIAQPALTELVQRCAMNF